MIERFLKDLRVLDLTTAYAGPYAGRILAEMGAEVIKIEAVQRIDMPVRGGCYPENDPGKDPWNRSGYFHMLNAHKYGITLDLSSREGASIFKRLVKISDVVIENFSPRVMENMGLSYEDLREIKSDIIMVGMSAFGHTGPHRNYVGFAPDMEARAGFISITGSRRGRLTSSVTGYTDWSLGRTAVAALITALFQWRRTGKGQYVDVAGTESVLAALGEMVLGVEMGGQVPGPTGSRSPYSAPQGCYRCRGEDEWLAIGVDSEEEWEGLCRTMGNPDWVREERFRDPALRYQHQDELDGLIQAWTIQRSAQEAAEILQQAGVPAGPVLNPKEIMQDPDLIRRSTFEVIDHPGDIGNRVHPRQMAANFGASQPSASRHAPFLGQDNKLILRGLLGIPEGELAQLESAEVIGNLPKAFPRGEERPAPVDYLVANGVAFFDSDYLNELSRSYGAHIGPKREE